MNQLFTVTLTDLGTYTLTVAAETPADAESIAKDVLFVNRRAILTPVEGESARNFDPTHEALKMVSCACVGTGRSGDVDSGDDRARSARLPGEG